MASKDIGLPLAHPSNLVMQSGISSSPGRKIISSQLMASISVSTATSGAHAPSIPQDTMAHTLVPSVASPTHGSNPAPETRLANILYIHTTPYNPSVWLEVLTNSNLLSSFPNLVHNITYGSPIGNPPPFSKYFFLPPNLPSTIIHPELIDQELLTEVTVWSIHS